MSEEKNNDEKGDLLKETLDKGKNAPGMALYFLSRVFGPKLDKNAQKKFDENFERDITGIRPGLWKIFLPVAILVTILVVLLGYFSQ